MTPKKIALFDADACNLMGRIISDGTSHLSQIITLYDESYIHQYVLDKEIRVSNKKVSAHLDYLSSAGLIDVLSDEDLLNMLNSVFDNEEYSCRNFVGFLQQAVGRLPYGHNLYRVYHQVFSSTYTSISSLLSDLRISEGGIQSRDGAGEIKSAVLAQVLTFTTYAEINLFLSNDVNARKMLVYLTSGRVEGYSPLATFILLRDIGFNQSDCLPYIQTYSSNFELKVKLPDDSEAKKTYPQIFNDIFNPNVSMEVTIDGYIKYL
jgi:hypothetical protein